MSHSEQKKNRVLDIFFRALKGEDISIARIANEYGISAVVQPGGSIKDQDSIDACDKYEMTMVFTGTRHFKH